MYLTVIIREVPEVFKKLSLRILNTQMVNKLEDASLILVALIQKNVNALIALYPNEFNMIKECVMSTMEFVMSTMKLVMSTMTQIEAGVKVLIATIPKEMILSLLEDVHTSVILPTVTEVLAIVNKMLAIPVVGMLF